VSIVVPTRGRDICGGHDFINHVDTNQCVDKLAIVASSGTESRIEHEKVASHHLSNVGASAVSDVAVGQMVKIGIEMHGTMLKAPGPFQIRDSIHAIIRRELLDRRNEGGVTVPATAMEPGALPLGDRDV
jgi:hypothetical protein